jgi:hypothetical protein
VGFVIILYLLFVLDNALKMDLFNPKHITTPMAKNMCFNWLLFFLSYDTTGCVLLGCTLELPARIDLRALYLKVSQMRSMQARSLEKFLGIV